MRSILKNQRRQKFFVANGNGGAHVSRTYNPNMVDVIFVVVAKDKKSKNQKKQ